MPHTAARMGTRERDPGRYQHHRPEQILLYQVVEEYCPAFTAHFVEQGRNLPGYLPRRALGCLQLQMSGFLSALRDAAHDRERSPVGRRCVARAAHTQSTRCARGAGSVPVGVEFPVVAAFPVCQPARNHGPGAGHRLPRDCDAPD